VAIPEPKPGLVIRYAFLWQHEAARGQEEAAKDRPCAIAVALKAEHGRLRVVVAPITHAAPGGRRPRRSRSPGDEAAAGARSRALLDHADQLNSFDWPGPDLRPVPAPGEVGARRFAYGYLGPATTAAMLDAIRAQRRQGLRLVGRDTPPGGVG